MERLAWGRNKTPLHLTSGAVTKFRLFSINLIDLSDALKD
jgi:hypothetical protein